MRESESESESESERESERERERESVCERVCVRERERESSGVLVSVTVCGLGGQDIGPWIDPTCGIFSLAGPSPRVSK